MADDFIQQIARLLGQSPEDTDRTLHALADSIRTEVENEGEVQIEGLGVFRRDGESLAFEPAPSLAQAVNHRYAGLPALESQREGDTPTVSEPEASEPEASEPEASEPEASDATAVPSEDEIEEPSESEDSSEGSPLADADPFAASDDVEFDLPLGTDPEPVRDLESSPAVAEESSTDASGPAGEAEDVGDTDLEPHAFTVSGTGPISEPSDTAEHEEESPATTESRGALPTNDASAPLQEKPFEAPDATPDAEFDIGPDAEGLHAGELETEADDETGDAFELEGETLDEDAFVDSDAEVPSALSEKEHVPEARSEDEEIDALLAGVWASARAEDDEDHPLGGAPPDEVEEADYSVVSEADDTFSDAPENEPLEEDVADDETEATVRPDEAEEPLSVLTAKLPAEPDPVDAAADPAEPSARDTAPGFAATAAASHADPVKKKSRPSRNRERSRAPLLLGMAAVLLATLALFWFLNREPSPLDVEPDPIAADAPTGSSIDPGVSPETPPPDSAAAVSGGAAPDASTPEPPQAAAPSNDPLRSTAGIDRAEGGFAWVVASEFSRAPAERRVAEFREQGFRADVIAEETGGRTRYRVALGQFGSLDEANRFRSDLPAGVPDDTWVLRL